MRKCYIPGIYKLLDLPTNKTYYWTNRSELDKETIIDIEYKDKKLIIHYDTVLRYNKFFPETQDIAYELCPNFNYVIVPGNSTTEVYFIHKFLNFKWIKEAVTEFRFYKQFDIKYDDILSNKTKTLFTFLISLIGYSKNPDFKIQTKHFCIEKTYDNYFGVTRKCIQIQKININKEKPIGIKIFSRSLFVVSGIFLNERILTNYLKTVITELVNN